jgi:hypothetical protein
MNQQLDHLNYIDAILSNGNRVSPEARQRLLVERTHPGDCCGQVYYRALATKLDEETYVVNRSAYRNI